MKVAGAGYRSWLPWTAALLLTLAAGAAFGTGPGVALPDEETLHWDSGPTGGFRINGDVEYIGAARFTPAWPCTVKAVRFYQYQEAEDGRVYAWGPGTQHRPGSQFDSEVYSGRGGMQWKRVDFDRPPACPAGTDFWVGVGTEYYNMEYPLGVDRGPMELYRGGFVKAPTVGESWYQLTEPPFFVNRNWCIRAIVVRGDGVEEELLPGRPGMERPGPTVVRGAVELAPGRSGTLLDVLGRSVARLGPGINDLSGLRPGCYFLFEPGVAGTRRLVLAR